MIRKKITASPTSSPKRKPVAAASILDRVQKVKELPSIVTATFYGPAGTGKTALAATFPKPLLLLDIGEKGTDTVSDVDGVDVLRIRSWSDIEDIYWELQSGRAKYATVVIDAVHSMQDLAITKAKELNAKDDDEQTSKRDFGTAAGLMKTWLFNYRDLEEANLNVVFLVHDRVSKEEGDEDDNRIAPTVGPRLMPSVASPLTGAVKVVGFTFIRQQTEKSKRIGVKSKTTTEYCLRIGPHAYYTTKVRKPKTRSLPDFIIDPSFDKIVKVMKGLPIQTGSPPKTPTPAITVRRKLTK